jgi:hypothetical protein
LNGRFRGLQGTHIKTAFITENSVIRQLSAAFHTKHKNPPNTIGSDMLSEKEFLQELTPEPVNYIICIENLIPTED